MCGIVGWSGKDIKKFNLNKLGILGIFNEKRGIDSCGLTTDFNIKVGVDKTKVFRDFMQTEGFTAPKKVPVVIGHTRKATGGLHDKYNAHPFGFGYNKEYDGYQFIGVHNGSLSNEHSLAKKYAISETAFKDDKTSKRRKIDSEILLETIYKTNSYEVLKDYIGAAALVWYDANDPNIMYCYHGESKAYDYKSAVLEEERPLFYWQESKNSLYVSSIAESLVAIGGKLNEVKSFDVNTVYKITNGNISSASQYKVDRSNSYKRKSSYTSYGCDTKSDYSCNTDSRPSYKKDTNPNVSNTLNPAYKHNIYKDVSLGGNTEIIDMFKLRYKRNGHNINGCYCYIENYGFYKLGVSIKKSEESLYNLCGKEFNNKNFPNISLKFKMKKSGVIPFLAEDIIVPEDFMFFFIDGIRMRTALDYEAITQSTNNYTISQLSMASTHPIMDDTVSSKNFNSQHIYHNGILVNGTFNFLGCNKIYTFQNGNCINIRPTEKYKLLTLTSKEEKQQSLALYNKASNNILLNEVSKTEKLKKEAEKLEKENEAIKNIIFNSLFSSYEDLSSGVMSLAVYEHNSLAVKSMDCINDFIESIDELMENDLKIEINGQK